MSGAVSIFLAATFIVESTDSYQFKITFSFITIFSKIFALYLQVDCRTKIEIKKLKKTADSIELKTIADAMLEKKGKNVCSLDLRAIGTSSMTFLSSAMNRDIFAVKSLPSETTFSFSVAARTEDNSTLDAAFLSAVTTSWDGVYEWVNRTDRDNHGKVRSIRLRIETMRDPAVGQYHAVYMYQDDGSQIRIFPLYEFDDPSSGGWVDYSSDSPAAVSYRLNAERFNTSPFKPGRWRMDRVVIDYDSSYAYIQTSAFGLVLETVSGYELFIEDGAMKMSFHTEGSGMVNGVLFKNPNPGEGDAFILTRIE